MSRRTFLKPAELHLCCSYVHVKEPQQILHNLYMTEEAMMPHSEIMVMSWPKLENDSINRVKSIIVILGPRRKRNDVLMKNNSQFFELYTGQLTTNMLFWSGLFSNRTIFSAVGY